MKGKIYLAKQSLRRQLDRSGDVGVNRFQATTARTRTQYDSQAARLHFGKDGLVSEVGEVVNILYKHIWQGHPLDTEKLELEIGDVMWFVATVCDAAGISLADALAKNQEKLAKRYPEGFSPQASIARVDALVRPYEGPHSRAFDLEATIRAAAKTDDPYLYESGE